MRGLWLHRKDGETRRRTNWRFYGNDLILVVALVLGAAFAPVLANHFAPRGTAAAEVYCDGQRVKSLAFAQDTVYSPDDGRTMVEVRDGKAMITASDCPDQLCVAMPPVTDRGGIVVCLPNRVLVRAGNASLTDPALGVDGIAG